MAIRRAVKEFPVDPLLAGVGLLAAVVPWVDVSPTSPRWHGAKTLTVEVGAAVLLASLLVRPPPAGVLRRGPAPFWIALLLWASLSCLLSPAKLFSVPGLLLPASGLIVYVAVASRVREERDLLLVLWALVAASTVAAVSGIAGLGQEGVAVATGVFHDHQLFGAFFLLLVPLLLAASLAPLPAAPRLAAQGALLLSCVALVLSQTRASWVGGAFAAAVFAGLCLWDRPGRLEGRPGRTWQTPQTLLSILLVAAAVGTLWAVAPQKGSVVARLQTLAAPMAPGKENSLYWRLEVWRGAWAMLQVKPLLGWGVGCYPLYQEAFTHISDSAAVVQQSGPIIPDEAHDSYLQLAVELGVPGVLLWLGVIGGVSATGLRALSRLPPNDHWRRWVLRGGLAALAGQAVDALANPAWQFGEVALYLWVVLGLTMAAARADNDGQGTRAFSPARLAAAGLAGVGMAYAAIVTAKYLPAPHL